MNLSTLKKYGVKNTIFESTKQRSKGLHKVIQTVFFPQYKYNKLRGTRRHGTMTFRSAKFRGKTIDRQLSKCIGVGTQAPLGATNETKIVLAFIHRAGYYIETSQKPVGFAPWRLATELDLTLRPVSSDQEDHRVVVEVKRGYHYRDCTVPGATSQRLVPEVPVSPRSLHELQTVLGAELLRKTDPSLPIKTMLLYVDDVELEVVTDFQVKFSETTELALLATSQVCAGKKRKTVKKKFNPKIKRNKSQEVRKTNSDGF
jgi:hypothetical protein